MIIALILAAALVAPAHAGHTEVCYWKDRHKAHCAEGFYLTEKRPAETFVWSPDSGLWFDKGKPCDPKGCVNE